MSSSNFFSLPTCSRVTETTTNNTPRLSYDYSSGRLMKTLTKLDTARFKAVKEPPDPRTTATTKGGWQIPPSLTQAPPGSTPAALPRIRLEPPRFDGVNAPEWIRQMQEYYNHYYTPLDDRLYLIRYLFDHPASEWLAYWTDNNAEKGWEDFLMAVQGHFAPNVIEDDVMMSLENTISHKENTPVSVGIAATGAQESSVLDFSGNKISQEFALEWLSDNVPCKVSAPDDGIVLTVSVPSDDVLTQSTPATSYGNDMKSFLEHQTLLSVENCDLFGLDQALASDARSIPPRNDVTCSSRSSIYSAPRIANSFSSNDSLPRLCMAVRHRFTPELTEEKDSWIVDEEQEVHASHMSNSSFKIVDHSPPVPSIITKRVDISKSFNSLSNHSNSPTYDGIKINCDDEADDSSHYAESAQPITDSQLEQALTVEARSPPPLNDDSSSSFKTLVQNCVAAHSFSGVDRVETMVLNSVDSNALFPLLVDQEFPCVIDGSYSHVAANRPIETGVDFILDFSGRFDTLPISPSLPRPLEVESSLLDLFDSKTMEVTYGEDVAWRYGTLPAGHGRLHNLSLCELMGDDRRVHDFVQGGSFIVKFVDQKFTDREQICGYITFFQKVETLIAGVQILVASYYDMVVPFCLLFFVLGVPNYGVMVRRLVLDVIGAATNGHVRLDSATRIHNMLSTQVGFLVTYFGGNFYLNWNALVGVLGVDTNWQGESRHTRRGGFFIRFSTNRGVKIGQSEDHIYVCRNYYFSGLLLGGHTRVHLAQIATFPTIVEIHMVCFDDDVCNRPMKEGDIIQSNDVIINKDHIHLEESNGGDQSKNKYNLGENPAKIRNTFDPIDAVLVKTVNACRGSK